MKNIEKLFLEALSSKRIVYSSLTKEGKTLVYINKFLVYFNSTGQPTQVTVATDDGILETTSFPVVFVYPSSNLRIVLSPNNVFVNEN